VGAGCVGAAGRSCAATPVANMIKLGNTIAEANDWLSLDPYRTLPPSPERHDGRDAV
jgi:hypothetical protein